MIINCPNCDEDTAIPEIYPQEGIYPLCEHCGCLITGIEPIICKDCGTRYRPDLLKCPCNNLHESTL